MVNYRCVLPWYASSTQGGGDGDVADYAIGCLYADGEIRAFPPELGVYWLEVFAHRAGENLDMKAEGCGRRDFFFGGTTYNNMNTPFFCLSFGSVDLFTL